MATDDDFTIRPIRQADDDAMAAIIREVMTAHDACGPGFAIHDDEVASMSRAYAVPRARYWVVEHDGQVVGGAGYAQLDNGPVTTCELRKMYFLPIARGRGLGATMLSLCLDHAQKDGFRRCYLETMQSMTKARALYERSGFIEQSGTEGNTGHFSCDCRYARNL